MKSCQRPHTLSGPFTCLWLAIAWLAACPTESVAIITFRSPSAPGNNTNPPTGDLADSGWQLQGQWGLFLGTPIAPNLFVTAKHVGGGIGQEFQFQGRSYTTIDAFDAPESDLRIWKVCGIFPTHATLYTAGNEIGKSLVVIGRGTQRSEEVVAPEGLGTGLKGWKWGAADHLQRWGENVVAGIVDGGVNFGELVSATFDAAGGDNEAHLSNGDSGGGLFIKEAGIWKLAGINYSVDGPFNTSTNGNGFNAAIFDQGGLYTKPEGNTWVLSADLPVDRPSAFYATRISANLTWINSIVAAHSAASYPPILQSTSDLGTEFADHPAYDLDESARTISLDQPVDTLFLRLRGCEPWEIESMLFENGSWILHYIAP